MLDDILVDSCFSIGHIQPPQWHIFNAQHFDYVAARHEATHASARGTAHVLLKCITVTH